MATRPSYNMNSSAVKRIMQEARELANDPCTDYSAAPLEDDIFEWHCTLRGAPGTEFEDGLYHFRILLPSEYPFRPPSIMMLTPNGRFELNTKICISFTSYHEELWQPAWGVRTAILGLQGFFPLKGTAAVGVGALEYPAVERKRLAALSRAWVCPTCKRTNLECLPDPPEGLSAHADSALSPLQPPRPSSSVQQPPEPRADPVERALNVLDAATATTIADPPPPIQPESSLHSPPTLIAPKPMRPIDAASIVIPASPLPQQSPPPAAPTLNLPAEQIRMRRTPAPATATAPVTTALARAGEPQSRTQSRIQTPTPERARLMIGSPPRPPILLDTAICVLLVLVFALICRRVL